MRYLVSVPISCSKINALKEEVRACAQCGKACRAKLNTYANGIEFGVKWECVHGPGYRNIWRESTSFTSRQEAVLSEGVEDYIDRVARRCLPKGTTEKVLSWILGKGVARLTRTQGTYIVVLAQNDA